MKSLLLALSLVILAHALAERLKSHEHDLCVVVRYYHGQQNSLLALLSSLNSAHGDESMLVHIIVTDEDANDARKAARHVTLAIEALNQYSTSSTFKMELAPYFYNSSVAKSYRSDNLKCQQQDYGYGLTDVALNNLVQREICTYMLFTNGDNLYNSNLLAATKEYRHDRYDLIGYYFSSRYTGSKVATDQGLTEREQKNVLFRSRMGFQQIDLGACIFKTELFRRDQNLRFCEVARNDPRGRGLIAEADGYLIEKIALREGIKQKVLDQVLFMHQ